MRLYSAAAMGFVLVAAGCVEGTKGPEQGEELPGGATTNMLLLGSAAFSSPATNITKAHESAFFSGNSFFNQAWVQAPASTQSRDGLGPLFNARSCSACHFKDGRGSPPAEGEQGGDGIGLLLRLSIPGQGAHGEGVPDPVYGGQLQPFSLSGVPVEGGATVHYQPESAQYADGSEYTLRVPEYVIETLGYGPLHAKVRVSPRVAPAMIGMGLLEAIDEARLEALSDPDDVDGDGISGRLQRVWDASVEGMAVGRFGWKAEQPSVRQQAAGAFLGDMGITSSLFPRQECSAAQSECAESIEGGQPEIPDSLLEKVVTYSSLLAVPVRTRFDQPEILHGKALFAELGCADCHVPSHTTGADADLLEVREQHIWPYTDLLLHDMGEGLSDHRPVFEASGREWRTPPLWGLGRYEQVNGHELLLHDGRARGVAEAVLWHGGEAEQAKQAFRQLASDDRQALIDFVRSL